MNLAKPRKLGQDGRPRSDFYPTRSGATLAFLEQTNELDSVQEIWEPACGDGIMVRTIEEHWRRNGKYWAGRLIRATDLNYHGFGRAGIDFLMERELWAPVIVTNPPFSLATQFAEHALDLGAEKLCLLLNISFLSSLSRNRLIDHEPLKAVYVFRNRFEMWPAGDDQPRAGTSSVIYAWFVWERGYAGAPVLGPRLTYNKDELAQ